MDRRIFDMKLVLLLANLFIGAICTSPPVDGLEPITGQPTNPCAYTLCPQNTACHSRPDPECRPQPYMICPMVAVCSPIGVQTLDGDKPGIQCGQEKCPPIGYECGLVYPFCPAGHTPCHPVLACVQHAQPGRPVPAAA